MLLLSVDTERVLPTVKSRCQVIELHPMAIDRVVKILTERGVGEEKANVIGRLSGGCIGWAIEAAREPAVLAGVHQRLERIAGVIEKTLDDADRLVGADQCHILPAAFVRRRGAPLRDRIWNESPCTWNGWA